ncbi:MAG: DUF6452 family protein [Flavobacterium sp.]
MKKIFALLLIAITFSGCEKDDICTEETTPRLIVEFYDITNNANVKNVLDLKVKGEGAADYMVFNSALDVSDQSRYLFNGSKLELPLRTDGTTTKYTLILNSTSTTLSNEDELTFNYSKENVFVSRACGYKTIFKLNSPGGAVVTDAPTPDTFWILQDNINVQTTNIETENENTYQNLLLVSAWYCFRLRAMHRMR